MVLLIDNYDSFTYNLYDYILQLGYACKVIRNDELSLDEIRKLNFDSIIISPGPGIPKDAGVCMELIETFFKDKPILGICLGYQALGEFFKAKLVKGIKPMHGKTSKVKLSAFSIIFKKIASPTQVMRYHSLVLEDFKRPLRITGESEEGEIMAFEHDELPIAGVQFHPESILTPQGLLMLKNWFDSLNQLSFNSAISI